MSVYFKGSKVGIIINGGGSSGGGGSYQIQVADLPDRTVELSNSSGTLSTKTTPATTGGVVTFDVENTGEYIITVSDTTGTLWTNTVTVNEIGIYNVKVPDIYGENESVSTTARYAMNRYTPAQLHTILQNGYFSKMFDVKSKWNYQDSGSIVNNYDFFVEKIEKTESGAEIAYMRLCYAILSYNINPYFSYMASETATSFSRGYSSAGGYKYSVMRQRMMQQGDAVYSQATGLKPSGNTTIADGTGIEFDKLYYSNGNGTTSGVYTYHPETDTFTQDTEMEYFSSSSLAQTGVKFVKGYFISVGTLTEEEFNAGYYYTYISSTSTSNPPRYTQATTYSSSTTYYGFYETLQENGVFYDALSSISQYLVKTDDLASTGLTNTTYTSQTEDYVDLPCVEEITGINRSTKLWGNRNSSTTTSGTNTSSYNIIGEGTKRPAYDDFQIQTVGTSYWTRSTTSNRANSFCFVYTSGYINGINVIGSYGVRLGFKLG